MLKIFLRKYKTDKIPQLINNLKGDMGFVGSQPEVPHYINMFTEEQKLVLAVQLGITGDAEDFLEKFFILINDNNLWKKMSSNSAFLFRGCFSVDKVYGHIINFLEILDQLYIAVLK